MGSNRIKTKNHHQNYLCTLLIYLLLLYIYQVAYGQLKQVNVCLCCKAPYIAYPFKTAYPLCFYISFIAAYISLGPPGYCRIFVCLAWCFNSFEILNEAHCMSERRPSSRVSVCLFTFCTGTRTCHLPLGACCMLHTTYAALLT